MGVLKNIRETDSKISKSDLWLPKERADWREEYTKSKRKRKQNGGVGGRRKN